VKKQEKITGKITQRKAGEDSLIKLVRFSQDYALRSK
jgi:hypothetical protein